VLGKTVILRRDRESPGLDAAVIQEIVPAGVATPLHRYDREDEVCYAVGGRFRIWRGEEVCDLGPSGVAPLPSGEAHSFACAGEGVGRISPSLRPAGLKASSAKSPSRAWVRRT
jgi:mannose-6-phosphate isomerase-like protein (cupin superfamily)